MDTIDNYPICTVVAGWELHTTSEGQPMSASQDMKFCLPDGSDSHESAMATAAPRLRRYTAKA